MSCERERGTGAVSVMGDGFDARQASGQYGAKLVKRPS
jgi:hypothetical protein